jgi:hypothetical protein
MGLSYGFYVFRECPGLQIEAKEKYEQLNDEEKSFYHDHLGYLLMATGISEVTEESVLKIINRGFACDYFIVQKDNDTNIQYTMEGYKNYLRKFIGFQTNVEELSDDKWIERKVESERRRLARLLMEG